jgi:hypothetical protein
LQDYKRNHGEERQYKSDREYYLMLSFDTAVALRCVMMSFLMMMCHFRSPGAPVSPIIAYEWVTRQAFGETAITDLAAVYEKSRTNFIKVLIGLIKTNNWEVLMLHKAKLFSFLLVLSLLLVSGSASAGSDKGTFSGSIKGNVKGAGKISGPLSMTIDGGKVTGKFSGKSSTGDSFSGSITGSYDESSGAIKATYGGTFNRMNKGKSLGSVPMKGSINGKRDGLKLAGTWAGRGSGTWYASGKIIEETPPMNPEDVKRLQAVLTRQAKCTSVGGLRIGKGLSPFGSSTVTNESTKLRSIVMDEPDKIIKIDLMPGTKLKVPGILEIPKAEPILAPPEDTEYKSKRIPFIIKGGAPPLDPDTLAEIEKRWRATLNDKQLKELDDREKRHMEEIRKERELEKKKWNALPPKAKERVEEMRMEILRKEREENHVWYERHMKIEKLELVDSWEGSKAREEIKEESIKRSDQLKKEIASIKEKENRLEDLYWEAAKWREGGTILEMSKALVEVKQTKFVLADDGETSTIKMIEGSVEFKSRATGKTITVSTGEMATATDKGFNKVEKFDIAVENAKWEKAEEGAGITPEKKSWFGCSLDPRL